MGLTLIIVVRAYQVLAWPLRYTLMRSWVPTSGRALEQLHTPGLGARAAWRVFWAAVGDTKPPRPPLP